MLHTVYILSDDWELIRPLPAHNNICFSYSIDLSSAGSLQNAYHFLSTPIAVPVSVTLKASNPVTADLVSYIVSFFFIPNYHRINQELTLHIICTDPGIFSDTKTKIIQEASEQGIENLVIGHLGEQGIENGNTNILFDNPDTLALAYSRSIQENPLSGHCFFFYATTQSDISRLIALIMDAELNLRSGAPLLYDAAVKMRSAMAENAGWKRKYALQEMELANFKTHLEIVQSSHQAKELQDYYTNEYEILPLWYKRFGHILKVIMGRRTFRSLFNDHVKKYKD